MPAKGYRKPQRVIRDDNGCHIWQGGTSNGRAYMRHDGTAQPVARIILEAKLGRPLLPGLFACHTCHNPLCVNLVHIYEGTRTDNQRDSARVGKFGKLTAQEVNEIREQKLAPKEVMQLYGMSRTQAYGIVSGTRWKHLTEEENVA